MVAVGDIEGAELFQIFKLVDDAVRLQIHAERRRLLCGEQIEIDILPVVLLFSGRAIGLFQRREQRSAELAGQINRAVHDIRIATADLDPGNHFFLIIVKHPLPGLSVHMNRRIPTARLVSVKQIFLHPVVGGEEVHVSVLKERRRVVDR